MRLKTLGVLVTTALAAFTMLYWFTDGIRRDSVAAAQEEELLEYGAVIFADDPSEPAAAGCAQCHGADGTGGDGGEDGNNVIGPNLHSPSLLEKLKANPNYVRLAVTYGGVVVSGNVNSQMPAWGAEVGGPLNDQQIEAVVALVTEWAEESEGQAPEEVEDTVEAGAEVYAARCASCHGAELEGVEGVYPNLQTIGSELITELPIEPSQLEQMQADYDEDPRVFLEKWIRDSATNYNDGQSTGMPPFPESDLSESQLRALITFLLDQTGE
jgi:mono/diheme cytochrome c family protein